MEKSKQEADERIARQAQEAGKAREEAEKLAKQKASQSTQSDKPEPEIKLDASIFDVPKAVATPSTVKPAEVPQKVASKPSQEQIKQTEEQRIAAAALAKKQADEQAKAEAKQREADAAKASAEMAFQSTIPPGTRFNYEAQQNKVSKVSKPRKPFPWGKLVIFLLVMSVGALFLAPYVLPTRDYRAKVEQILSAKLQQPVHIGQLAGRFLPTPRLELGDIYIGDAKQLQLSQALIDFSILGLISETKPIDSIELKGVNVTGAGLQESTTWLQQLAADNQYPVRRMVITQGVLDADAIQFNDINGEVIFNKAGNFTQANLRANSGNILLGISAASEGIHQVAITMYSSALPLLPSWSFDELTAKGELSRDGLRISEFDGRILGGILQGDANINWSSGWNVDGSLIAKTITMQNMSQGLTGDMEGSARFQMQATSLSELADEATLEGSFVIGKGIVNGIDIVQTGRLRSKESLPGGRTHFDGLTGVLTVENGRYTIRRLRMDGGELIVTGALNITDQQLSGRISADLTKWAQMGKVTMLVGGTTDNPSLRAR